MRVTHFPSPPTRFASRYAGAMELLQDTQALILDLTVNHGGGTDTEGFFLSYFLAGGIELGRVHWRGEPTEIIATTNDVPGPRYGDAWPIFVAISQHTFSAGEAVAFI
jgi:C-terminal processing protease CtpA/Prc